MNIIEELRGNYDEAEKLWETYENKLVEFRSNVKNDVASLEASARKTAEAAQRMNKAYGDVLALLNGEDMRRAIDNAERLAAAMIALSQLQSHKLVLSVVDQSKAGAP